MMFKYIVGVLTATTLMIFSYTPVQAARGNPLASPSTSPRLERMENREERREELAEQRQERRENIAEKHAVRLRLRFDGYYDRLSRILAKIRARFEILAQNGKNVTEANSKLDQAQMALEQAKTYADQAIGQFEAIEPENYQSQRQFALAAAEQANKSREKFQEVRELLIEAIQLVKPLANEEE